MKINLVGSLVIVCCFMSASAKAVTIEWTIVGNPGNAGDTTGAPNPAGAVDYVYRISKHEVTNNQYAEFLNQVAATDDFVSNDPHLYNDRMKISRSGSAGSYSYAVDSGFESHPVSHVSFFDAMRFVNWLENGQGSGDTESGVYKIASGLFETRAPGAQHFIPSTDEWYKAAFHDPTAPGGYWDYPTQSNTPPTGEAPPGGANSANMFVIDGDGTTGVGAYTGSSSFYGTFDQAGNVFEWTEGSFFGNSRGSRGGSWLEPPIVASSSEDGHVSPDFENIQTGFRVATITIPEPSAAVYVSMLLSMVLLIRKRT